MSKKKQKNLINYMGKIKGFMEFERIKEPVVKPKDGSKIITNLQLLLKIKTERTRC